MLVLIVEQNPELCELWAVHLARIGFACLRANSSEAAIEALRAAAPAVVVIDLAPSHAQALAVADYAAYRRPDARMVFVTASSFFSTGAIFALAPNAAAALPARTTPEDLAAVVEYHARRVPAAAG